MQIDQKESQPIRNTDQFAIEDVDIDLSATGPSQSF